MCVKSSVNRQVYIAVVIFSLQAPNDKWNFVIFWFKLLITSKVLL
jgi:hypothetical protein